MMAVLISITWVFPKIVVSQNGWFVREIPIKLDDLEGKPLFLETPTWPFLRWCQVQGPSPRRYTTPRTTRLALCHHALFEDITKENNNINFYTGTAHQPKQSSTSTPSTFVVFVGVADLFLPFEMFGLVTETSWLAWEGPWFPCWICPKPPGPMLWKLTPWRWSRKWGPGGGVLAFLVTQLPKIWVGMDIWVVVSNMFYFYPYLGKIPILTNIFQMGWNHQLDMFIYDLGGCFKHFLYFHPENWGNDPIWR